jgi:hypothetical protein
VEALPKELGEQALQRFAETGWPARSVDRTEFGKVSLLNEPAAIANSLITLMQRFEERDAQSFGVGIIWLDDHDQIAPVLQAVRKRDPGIVPYGEDEPDGPGA